MRFGHRFLNFEDRFLSVGLGDSILFSISGLAFFAFVLIVAFYDFLQLLEGSVLPSVFAYKISNYFSLSGYLGRARGGAIPELRSTISFSIYISFIFLRY